MCRFPFLTALTAFGSALLLHAGSAAAFGFDEVVAKARDAAAVAWTEAPDTRPAELRRLNYDGYREIRYRPERAIWRDAGLPFELQFFHLGGGHVHPVQVHEVHEGRVRRFDYEPAAWDFGRHGFDRRGWSELGHAGFRVHHALNTPAFKDELVVFLGASYFRALGRGQQYGLSARALAVDTVGAAPGQGEEFPRFTHFWIERPAVDATSLTIHALVQSPRVAAAVRFVVAPGETTVIDTRLRVFLRNGAPTPAMLGIAPLTSMFLHGENQAQRLATPTAERDFRPEVHDSDGLLLAGVGPGAPAEAVEWIWRPLINPPAPLAPAFGLQRLQGFGLMQRDRSRHSYEDPEARYEKRPSAWVEPVGDWGPGRVQQLLLPTPDETEDNIVATWVPAQLPGPAGAEFRYRLHWEGSLKTQPPLGHTVQSRRGRSWAALTPGEVQHAIDFDGPALRALPAGATVEAVASTGPGGRVSHAHAYPNPTAERPGQWRMHLRLVRDDATQPLELRAWLRHAGSALTETWAALLPPEPVPLDLATRPSTPPSPLAAAQPEATR
jgi:periplasmic glucans biosynthesis protein